jgi:hypothetical protein
VLHREHAYHVCRCCGGRFAGHAAWGQHRLLGRPRCTLPAWFVSGVRLPTSFGIPVDGVMLVFATLSRCGPAASSTSAPTTS